MKLKPFTPSSLVVFGLLVLIVCPPTPAAEPKERITLKGHRDVSSVAYSKDGKILATVDKDKMRLWDPTSGKEVLSINVSVVQVAFSPDGKTLATCDWKKIKLWDSATGKEITSFDDSAWMVEFSPDGKFLGTPRGQWELAIRKFQSTETGVGQFAVAYTADGKVLATSDSKITLSDTANGKSIRTFGEDGRAFWSVAFSPQGKVLAAVGYTSSVCLFNPATGEEFKKLEGAKLQGWPLTSRVLFSPDGNTLVAFGQNDGDLRNNVLIWDVPNRKKIAVPDGMTGPVTYSPDGKTLATGGKDGVVRLWDSKNLK